MIITISGLVGCGKTTVGKLVARALKIPLLSPTFKDLAQKKGLSLMKFQKLAERDDSIDKEFDEKLKREVKKIGSCVVATWLSPWIIQDANLKVWLDASEKVRAKRISRRDNINIKQALLHIRKRDKQNILRYKKIYGINITNHDDFDLIVRSDEMSAREVARIIVKAAQFLKKGG
ncbi:MAG: cytidylate kinase family protein [Candidatus Anstonellales archaeon]